MDAKIDNSTTIAEVITKSNNEIRETQCRTKVLLWREL
jgi:hypothetical protein